MDFVDHIRADGYDVWTLFGCIGYGHGRNGRLFSLCEGSVQHLPVHCLGIALADADLESLQKFWHPGDGSGKSRAFAGA